MRSIHDFIIINFSVRCVSTRQRLAASCESSAKTFEARAHIWHPRRAQRMGDSHRHRNASILNDLTRSWNNVKKDIKYSSVHALYANIVHIVICEIQMAKPYISRWDLFSTNFGRLRFDFVVLNLKTNQMHHQIFQKHVADSNSDSYICCLEVGRSMFRRSKLLNRSRNKFPSGWIELKRSQTHSRKFQTWSSTFSSRRLPSNSELSLTSNACSWNLKNTWVAADYCLNEVVRK